MPKILKTTYMEFDPANENKTAWKTINENGRWKSFEAIKWVPNEDLLLVEA